MRRLGDGSVRVRGNGRLSYGRVKLGGVEIMGRRGGGDEDVSRLSCGVMGRLGGGGIQRGGDEVRGLGSVLDGD